MSKLQEQLEQAKKDKEIQNQAMDKEIADLEAKIAKEQKPKLDYNKPVLSLSSDGTVCILVANCDTKSYKVLGYDWLRLSDGKFNSKYLWKTKQEAVDCYSYNGKPFNADFDDLAALQEDVTANDDLKLARYDIDNDETEVLHLGLSIKDELFVSLTDGDEGDVYHLKGEELAKAKQYIQRAEATLKRKEKR
jgi:hypothetical protein